MPKVTLYDTPQPADRSLALALDTSRGGRWTRLRARPNGKWTDLLWVAPKKPARNPFQCAAYVMAPWCNRVAGSTFIFRNTRHRLRPNSPDGSALHGDVYGRPWTVEDAGGATLAASLDTRRFPDFNFPFPLQLRQRVRVGARALVWSMRIKNLSTVSVPVGFGLHPFFRSRIDGDWGVLTVPAARAYPSKNAVPTGDPRRVPEAADLRRPIRLRGRAFDACYTGIRGPITMWFPKLGWGWSLELGPGMDHVYLYSPPFRDDVLCIEPMSLSVNGFNRHADGKKNTGVRVLAAGASWGSSIKIRVKSKSPVFSN